MISTAAAVLVFLILLLFAVQLLVNLYATSTMTAVGFDAARTVAAQQGGHREPEPLEVAQHRAEVRARDLLGEIGRDAEFRWEVDGDVVRLRLSVSGPGVLPRAVSTVGGPHRIERTFVVRVEEER